MITRADLDERVREWDLRDDVVEKDYLIGWLLWGIGSDSRLARYWAFKGGTCLKKCYIETFRFSEDLDFTVLPGGPLAPEEVVPVLVEVLRRVQEESGIDFSQREISYRLSPDGESGEGRVYYIGPRGAPSVASVKLDLTASEQVARPTVLRTIGHSYPDDLPSPATVRCYSFEEVFAEKLRAMGERGRPRDLYDIILLARRRDVGAHAQLVRETLISKCRTKGVEVPTLVSITGSPSRAELESEWENMLGHQLPLLPPFEHVWGALPELFAWLEGSARPVVLDSIPPGVDEDLSWSPPPLVALWGGPASMETIRFAAANHLCISLGYQGSTRVIEPYSLRKTKAGNLLLHATRLPPGEHRAYRVDRIQSARVTKQPFRPRYPVEFSAEGRLIAPPTRQRRPTVRPSTQVPLTGKRSVRKRSSPTGSRSSRSGPVYEVRCPMCQRMFRRKKHGLTLRPHKDRHGLPCAGRSGFLVNIR